MSEAQHMRYEGAQKRHALQRCSALCSQRGTPRMRFPWQKSYHSPRTMYHQSALRPRTSRHFRCLCRRLRTPSPPPLGVLCWGSERSALRDTTFDAPDLLAPAPAWPTCAVLGTYRYECQVVSTGVVAVVSLDVLRCAALISRAELDACGPGTEPLNLT